MAVYGIIGVKSNSEKFAGGNQTLTFESLMPNGKSLQACTSHDLGQNFAKAWDWTVQDKDKNKVYPWQNSWGFSTRSIGGLIMAHGDENGLKLPPNIAPIQVVIIPIPGHKLAFEKSKEIESLLKTDFRIETDLAEGETAGFKFNHWEIKGVPIRLEIGDRDLADNSVVLCRRDTGEKQKVKIEELKNHLKDILSEIQTNLFEKHKIHSRSYLYR